MKKILVRILTLVGGLTVLVICCGLAAAAVFWWTGREKLPQEMVLQMDFQKGLAEALPRSPLGRMLTEDTLVVREVVEGLERASRDPRVKALVARVGAASMGMARIQEVREALAEFRKSGKPAVAFGETFGEFGPGNGAYYLATAFDEIYLQPSGDVGLTGLVAEAPFFRGTLDKLGIVPRLDHRKEYKTAMNTLTERRFTEAHRESTRRILDSLFSRMVADMASARGIDEEELRSLIDEGPFSARRALELKLIDGLAYGDEVMAMLKKRVGPEPRLASLSRYRALALERPPEDAPAIALIHGTGAVVRGEGEANPLSGRQTMGSDTLVRAFRQAVKDEEVKAILFRVDSPGGSYVASDSIWSETVRARKAGKPVVVSMGNLAGSGGYFVAMAADKIVAQPGTLTGSVGVVAGKLVFDDFWDKLGVSWDDARTSANASMWSPNRDYTPEQWARFQKWLDRVYDDFVTKFSQGRGLSRQEAEAAAKGQVWTGVQARKLGLVDELGGFSLALKLARQEAGIAESAPVRLKAFPEAKPPLRRLLDRLLGRSEEFSEVAVLRALDTFGPLGELARRTGWAGQSGVLAMPAVWTSEPWRGGDFRAAPLN